MLASAERTGAETWGRFQQQAGAAMPEAEGSSGGLLGPDVMVEALTGLGGGGAPGLASLHRLVAQPESGEQEEAAALARTAPVRRSSIELLRGVTYPNAVIGIGAGLGLPIGALVLFGLLGLVVGAGGGRRSSGGASPPSPPPPPPPGV